MERFATRRTNNKETRPGMQRIAGSRESYPAVNAIFPAVKHYFFLQNVFKCCQKIVIYLFHLFTPSNLGIACQRHARVGLRPKYPPIIARFPPVKNFSYIPAYIIEVFDLPAGMTPGRYIFTAYIYASAVCIKRTKLVFLVPSTP